MTWNVRLGIALMAAVWGLGPIVQLPTNSNEELGNKNWGSARQRSCCTSSMATHGRWPARALRSGPRSFPANRGSRPHSLGCPRYLSLGCGPTPKDSVRAHANEVISTS